jgi:hypothetical protein
MKGKKKQVIRIRNGKVFVSCWLSAELVAKGKEKAIADTRTFTSILEIALKNLLNIKNEKP